jgi:hypothetical protein
LRPYLITGLPRSRTAWLATVATGDESVCWHEPLTWLDRWEDVFTKIWGYSAHRYVGISDSGLGFHLPEIITRAAPRILIVDRDIAEVEASLVRTGVVPTNYCAILKECLSIEHPSIMRVPFKALEANHIVAQCLRHLMPDAKINADRIKVLQHMNVQTDMRRIRQLAQKRAGDMVAILGADVAAQIRAA